MDQRLRTTASGVEGSAGKPRKRAKLMVGAVAGCVLIGAAVVAWSMRPSRPPPPTADPVTLAKFAATPAFVQLPEEQKAPYLQALRQNIKTLAAAAEKGELTKAERTQAARNAFRTGARVEMQRYSTLPPGPARKAHLDKVINELEQLRQYSARLGNGAPQVGGNPVEMKQFIETLSPQERVQMAQFAADLFQRRLERGLMAWPFGGGNPSGK